MAQAGYTPIQLYYSTTAAAVPTSGNLASGELAINIVDGKLYYKDNGGSVQTLAVSPSMPQVISVNSSSDALRITQTGTGNALVVEDSTNPDSTPFVVDASGNVGIGTTTPASALNIERDGAAQFRIIRNSTDAQPPFIYAVKRRGTNASKVVVNDNDLLINIQSYGYDGTSDVLAATITAAVDGTPGTNDMPGRLVFSTTADGASSPTERMRITNAGNALIGGTAVRGTTVGSAHLDIFNGTAPAGTLTNGISLYSASGDFNFMDSAGDGYKVGYRNIPAVADKTSSYILATTDVGKVVGVGTGGSITIPDATFAAGDAVIIFNNTTGSVTITCSITTAYIAGADTDKATLTLATRGIASILFVSGTVCVVSGNVT